MQYDKDSELYIQRTYRALTNLYLNCRDIQKHPITKEMRQNNALSHAKEFGTIKLATARRTGHTSSIAKFVCENEMSFVIILPTFDHSEHMMRNIYNLLGHQNIKHLSKDLIEIGTRKIHIVTNKTIDTRLRGLEIDAILCDISCLLSQKNIEKIYQVGLPCMHNKEFIYFMFIG